MPTEFDDPRKFALQMGLLDNEDDFADPQRFASQLGLTNHEREYQNGPTDDRPLYQDAVTSEPQENYLDDSFGNFARNLPIDEPSGSIVSGGREDLYHKYSQMLEQKPKSERVLEDYMGRRPSFANYNPSGHDKLTAAVMGGIAGLNRGGEAGIRTAQEWRNKPFDRQVQDYNSEGRFVDDYAKLQDSSRNRQMSSLLAQMRMQETERVNKSREKYQQDTLTERRRNSQEIDKDRDESRKGTREDREYNRGFREREFGERQRHNKSTEDRLMRSLGGREEKRPSTMQTPSIAESNRALTDRILTDPGAKALFDDSGKTPIWIVEDREPTPIELRKYQELMRSVEQGNMPSIESLGFGR